MKRQKLFSQLFYIFSLVLICFSLSSFAYAEKAKSNNNYYFFSNPSAIYYDTNLFVSQDDEVLIFDNYSLSKSITTNLKNVEKMSKFNNLLFLLDNKALYSLNIENDTLLKLNNYIVNDFCLINDKVYILSDNKISIIDTDFSGDNELSSITHPQPICNITSNNDTLFFTTIIPSNNKKVNIYSYKNNTTTLINDWVTKPDKFIYLDSLYTLTKTTLSDQINNFIIDDNFLCYDFTFDGNNIIYLSDMNEIISLNIKTKNKTVLLASSSHSEGYYFNPNSISSNMMNVLVSDTYNNRVQITDKNTRYIEVFRPTFALMNNHQDIYVVSNKRKIIKYDYNLTMISSIELEKDILDIAISPLNELYILLSDGAYILKDDKLEFIVDCTNFFITDKNEFFYLKDSAVYNLSDRENPIVYIDFTSTKFVMDNDNNCYFLTDNKLVKIDQLLNYQEFIIDENVPKLDYLAISKSSNNNLSYGDILFCITPLHKITKISKKTTNFAVYNGDNVLLDELDNENIIYSTLYDTEVFAKPVYDEPIANIKKDTLIIVAKKELNETKLFSYVYYPCFDKSGKSVLVQGFVFKTKLKMIKQDNPPIEKQGILLSDKYIYSYPSTLSDEITPILETGTKLNLLPFCEFTTNEGKWLKVSTLDNITGYILSQNVSIRNYKPTTIMPHYNANIKVSQSVQGALIYKQVGENFEVDISAGIIPNNAKIEVVGKFDKRNDFTKIKYYDNNLGTITCFVQTADIHYNSLTNVQIVAFIIIAITVILSVILIILKHNYHKNS